MQINELRGEAELKLSGYAFKLAATMESIAALSRAVDRPTLGVLYQRLIGSEMDTTLAALQVFVEKGVDPEGKPMKKRDAAQAAARLYAITDAPAVQTAFMEILKALTREPKDEDAEGNQPAG